MAKTLTEQKVLKKLEIDDFRHITKDKVIELFSMLDKMDPEVAKKALEQFPDFSGMMKEIVNDYRVLLENAFTENRKSAEAYYDACKGILNSLQKRLDTEDLDFEQRNMITEQMLKVAKMMDEKDTENKSFLLKAVKAFAVVGGTIVLVGLSALGGVSKIGNSNKS